MPVEKKDAGANTCQDADQSAMKDGRPPVQAKAQDQDVLPGILGKQLRAAYGELLNSPIPDAFTDLIKKLEGGEGKAEPAQDGRSSEPPAASSSEDTSQ